MSKSGTAEYTGQFMGGTGMFLFCERYTTLNIQQAYNKGVNIKWGVLPIFCFLCRSLFVIFTFGYFVVRLSSSYGF